MGIRDKYLAARKSAGEDFISKNPGKHFFFNDLGADVCVFCGMPEALSEVDCPGDLRRQPSVSPEASSDT